MRASIIVAMARNQVIGNRNDLPWYLSADLKHFKQLTTGNTVIMGRKTWDSILARGAGPLPDRYNVVVTAQKNFRADGATVVHSLGEAIKLPAMGKPFVIGGASLYSQMLPFSDTLFVTQVDAIIPGDTFFPVYSQDEWREVSRETYPADAKNEYPYSFVELRRKW